jgi:hypothetical protein
MNFIGCSDAADKGAYNLGGHAVSLLNDSQIVFKFMLQSTASKKKATSAAYADCGHDGRSVINIVSLLILE